MKLSYSRGILLKYSHFFIIRKYIRNNSFLKCNIKELASVKNINIKLNLRNYDEVIEKRVGNP